MGAVAGIATLVLIVYYVWCGMGDIISELKEILKGEDENGKGNYQV